ncbi:hypothetical protein TL16_g03278 [Triparma laevis f. inornata]|uniref:glutathione transferase n=2 Tax=Triparma laevis TaxID=1534972 RepID=A0A9W7DY95_9STRA|nr:hypothetical protein TrLO_g5797 [Triparma laevis f. longispina]GMH61547.1 hypothetical protein TL16_g03278 [Triparma laevis f. inornata]
MTLYARVPTKILMYDVKMDGATGAQDRSAWFEPKKQLKIENPFINLPYIIDHERDGLIVSQTNACMSYMGRRLGLWGRSEKDVAMCETFLAEVMDLRNQMTGFSYRGDPSYEKTKEDGLALLNTVLGKSSSLRKFELHFKNKWEEGGETIQVPADRVNIPSEGAQMNAKPFLLDYCTAPDFHLFEMCSQFADLCDWCGGGMNQKFIMELPYVTEFYTSFQWLEGMQEYFKSELHHGTPFNNKAARFGSIPSSVKLKAGENMAFKKGQDYDWGVQERFFNC